MEKMEELILKNDYIVINIMNYCRKLIPILKKYKKEIWCDIHDYTLGNYYYDDFIEAADYIFMSSENIPEYHNFMKKLINKGKKMIFCTHGKNGSTGLDRNGKFIDIEIIKDYERVDTNGAGDSFFAGVLYGIDKGYDIKKSMKYGTIAGGLTINSKEIFNENLSEKLIEEEYISQYKLK